MTENQLQILKSLVDREIAQIITLKQSTEADQSMRLSWEEYLALLQEIRSSLEESIIRLV